MPIVTTPLSDVITADRHEYRRTITIDGVEYIFIYPLDHLRFENFADPTLREIGLLLNTLRGGDASLGMHIEEEPDGIPDHVTFFLTQKYRGTGDVFQFRFWMTDSETTKWRETVGNFLISLSALCDTSFVRVSSTWATEQETLDFLNTLPITVFVHKHDDDEDRMEIVRIMQTSHPSCQGVVYKPISSAAEPDDLYDQEDDGSFSAD